MKTNLPSSLWVWLSVVLLTSISCGLAAPVTSTIPPNTQPPTLAPTMTAVPENTKSPALPADLWMRRDVPPSGVIDQIKLASPGGAGGGGGSICQTYHVFEEENKDTGFHALVIAGGVVNGLRVNKVNINDDAYFCAYDVGSGESVKMVLTDPAGESKTVPSSAFQISRMDAYGGSFTYLEYHLDITAPGSPVGEFHIALDSRNGSVDLPFTVSVADQPNAGDVDSRDAFGGINVKAGESIVIPLAGFPPRAPLTFELYGFVKGTPTYPGGTGCPPCTSETMEFLTSWSSSADERGELVEILNTDGDTPKKHYVLLISGPDPQRCQFNTPSLTNKGFKWNKIRCDVPIGLVIQ